MQAGLQIEAVLVQTWDKRRNFESQRTHVEVLCGESTEALQGAFRAMLVYVMTPGTQAERCSGLRGLDVVVVTMQ